MTSAGISLFTPSVVMCAVLTKEIVNYWHNCDEFLFVIITSYFLGPAAELATRSIEASRESTREAHRTGPKYLYNSPSTTARRQLRIKTNWFINSVAVADLSVWGVIPNMFVYDVKLGSSGDI